MRFVNSQLPTGVAENSGGQAGISSFSLKTNSVLRPLLSRGRLEKSPCDDDAVFFICELSREEASALSALKRDMSNDSQREEKQA